MVGSEHGALWYHLDGGDARQHLPRLLQPCFAVFAAGDLTDRWILEVLVRTAYKEAGAILLHVVAYPWLVVLWLLPWLRRRGG